jgi:hypothetical protein
MDDIDNPGDINTRPERASRYDPAAITIFLLLEQFLLVRYRGFIKRIVHLLGYTLSMSIAPYINNAP